MNRSLCELLDEYLLGLLPEGPRGEFAAHLSGCSECQEALRRQAELDRLLMQAAPVSDPSPRLLARVEGAIERQRWLRLRRYVSYAAAAAVLISGAGWLMRGGADAPRGPMVQAISDAGVPKPGVPKSGVTVQFSGEVLAVPRQTSRANVTILWLYPTLPDGAEERSQQDEQGEPFSSDFPATRIPI